MLYLKNVFRALFDHVRDGVPVRGARKQGLQNQHVERALEHLGGRLIGLFFGHTGD